MEIEKYVNISTNASIYTSQHEPNDKYFGVTDNKMIICDRADNLKYELLKPQK